MTSNPTLPVSSMTNLRTSALQDSSSFSSTTRPPSGRALSLLLPLLAVVLGGLGSTARAQAVPSAAAEQVLPVHAGRDAYGPAARFGNGVFLIAWQSGRLEPGDLRQGPKYSSAIVGMRVDRTGKPLDAQPFVISGAAHLRERPRIAFDGQHFLAVWQDFRNGKDWDVYAARITPEGKVLEPDGILVSGGPHNQAKPHVGWDGKSFVVVWQDFRGGRWYEVYGARVSPQGTVLDADGVALASARAHVSSPVVAGVGNGKSLVVGIGGAGPIAQPSAPTTGRFFLDGKAEAPAFSFGGQSDASPVEVPHGLAALTTLATGPEGFLLAWKTDAPYSRGNARNSYDVALFDRQGALQKNLLVSGAHPDFRILDPSTVWSGRNYALGWHEQISDRPGGPKYDAAFTARIAQDGTLVGPVTRLAGTLAAPARQVYLVTDYVGTTLAVYEKHPTSADEPISVGVQVMP